MPALDRLTHAKLKVYAALFANDLTLEEACTTTREIYQQLQAELLQRELPSFADLRQEARLQ
jgi:hypothetical protein